jgi:hypothetical protein
MVRRAAVPTPKAIAFFRKHAGYARKPSESVSHARARCARELARAEAEASARGWRVEWEGDPEPYQIGDAEDEMPSEVLGAVLRDENGHVLGSLWGIGDPTRQYRRVVEAELADEALYELDHK